MEEIAQVYARSLFEVAQEQGKLDVDPRAARAVRRRARREPRAAAVLLLAVLLDRGEAGRAAARGRGRRPGDRELPRAADREPPHAGRSSASAREYDAALGRGEQAAAGRRSRAPSSSTTPIVEQHRRRDRRADRPQGRADQQGRPRRSSAASSLRVGNAILDASIRNRLEQLRKQVAQRVARRDHKEQTDTTCRSSPTRSPPSSRAASRGSTPASAELTEVGTVLSVGDGIARIHGLENVHVARDARAAARRHRPGAEPRVRQRRRRAVRRLGEDRRGRHGQAHRPPARDPGRRRAARPHRRPARQPARRQGRRSTRPRRARPSSRRPASSSASRSPSRCRPA